MDDAGATKTEFALEPWRLYGLGAAHILVGLGMIVVGVAELAPRGWLMPFVYGAAGFALAFGAFVIHGVVTGRARLAFTAHGVESHYPLWTKSMDWSEVTAIEIGEKLAVFRSRSGRAIEIELDAYRSGRAEIIAAVEAARARAPALSS